MNSVTFQVSLNWHLITGLSTLDQCPERPWHRMQDFCHPKPPSIWNIPHPALHQRFWGTDSPTMQDGSLKSLHRKNSPQGSQWTKSETLIPYLTIVDTKNKLALSRVSTLPASTQREGRLDLTHLQKSTWNIPFPSRVKFHCFGWLACGFSYWCVISEEFSCNFPLLKVFFVGDIKILVLGWSRGSWIPWLCSWMTCFK